MSKKLLVLAFAFVLVGAGCFGGDKKTEKKEVVTGDWVLAFDLPDEWIMVKPYLNSGNGINLEAKINRTDSEVILQDSKDTITINEENDSDFTLISATYLDSRRIIPSEAEDLGNGFSRMDTCKDKTECQLGNTSNFEYYLDVDNKKFKFKVFQKGQDISVAEKIIMSARITQEQMM